MHGIGVDWRSRNGCIRVFEPGRVCIAGEAGRIWDECVLYDSAFALSGQIEAQYMHILELNCA